MDILQEHITIGFTDVDPSGQITLYSVFDYFQKAAIAHAEQLGVGRDALAAKNQVWLLSRMSARIARRPRLDEQIRLRTWPRGFEKLFTIRDYDMSSHNGELLVSARSGWLLIDKPNRRPLRPSALAIPLPQNEGLNALEGIPAALGARTDMTEEGGRNVTYSDIDYNGHVNNARYIQWIQDVCNGSKLQNARKIECDINYLSEVTCSERIQFYSVRENTGAVSLTLEGRKADSQAAFRAVIRYLL